MRFMELGPDDALGMKHFSYQERLREFGLFSLESED